jgi:rhodanese-related sulfurtransferase
MKTAQDYMQVANADVPKMSAADAISVQAKSEGVFIAVRDSAAITASGTIAGVTRIPRGMLEFRADPAVEAMFDPVFADKSAAYYLICGAGGQAALAGKTMKDMGFTNVTNIGGFGAWKEAGGPVEA